MGKKRYRVTGVQAVADHAPGEQFSHEFTPDVEAFLLQIGAIEVVKASKTEKKEG